jgi:hypothetical protein
MNVLAASDTQLWLFSLVSDFFKMGKMRGSRNLRKRVANHLDGGTYVQQNGSGCCRGLQRLRYLHHCLDCYRAERTSSRAGLPPAVDQRLFTAHFRIKVSNRRERHRQTTERPIERNRRPNSGDLGKMRDEIAGWFDNAMERIGRVTRAKRNFGLLQSPC